MRKKHFIPHKDGPVLLGIVVLWLGAIFVIPNTNTQPTPTVTAAPTPTSTIPVVQKILKIAAVGDSNTYGAGVKEDDREKNAYPAQLQRLLGDKYQVFNYGVGGTTLINGKSWSYTNTEDYTKSQAIDPDIVLVMLGTNDAMELNWDADKYEQDLQKLVNTYKNLESSPKVYLLTIPYAYNHGDDLSDIDIDGDTVTNEVVPLIKKVAKSTQSPVIDVYDVTKDHSELFPDKVHPNAVGYGMIAETVYEAIR